MCGRAATWKDGEDNVRREDVARKAGCSPSTVSRVLLGKGYVSESARQRVLAAAAELGYTPNNLARSLTMNRSNVIAVLIEDLMNPYYFHIVEAMLSKAKEKGLVLSLFAVSREDFDNTLDTLISNRVIGVVNLAMFEVKKESIKRLEKAGILTVNFSEKDENVVTIDYSIGVESALACFQRNGHRTVGFLSGLDRAIAVKDVRYNAFFQNLGKYGLKTEDRFVLCGDYPRENADRVGYNLVKRMIKNGLPDGLLCMTDMMALGAIKALESEGIRVPADISVIGCDNLEFTEFLHPALTTISVDKKTQGGAYIDYFLSGGYGQWQVSTYFVERESVANRNQKG